MSKNILVTGASSGIGAATVRLFADDGYKVFGTVRRAQDIAGVESRGGTAILMDVTDETSIAAARDKVAGKIGHEGLDALINNAGIPCAGPLELMPLSDIRKAFDVNVRVPPPRRLMTTPWKT